jgi:hypothetical protein
VADVDVVVLRIRQQRLGEADVDVLAILAVVVVAVGRLEREHRSPTSPAAPAWIWATVALSMLPALIV